MTSYASGHRCSQGIADIDDALIEQVLELDEVAGEALRTIRASFSAWQTTASAVCAMSSGPCLLLPQLIRAR